MRPLSLSSAAPNSKSAFAIGRLKRSLAQTSRVACRPPIWLQQQSGPSLTPSLSSVHVRWTGSLHPPMATYITSAVRRHGLTDAQRESVRGARGYASASSSTMVDTDDYIQELQDKYGPLFVSFYLANFRRES